MEKIPEFRAFLELTMGINEPWRIENIKVDTENWRVDIDINFTRGATFPCPQCGADGCAVHDTKVKSWRHLNLFQYKVYITARVPRVSCKEHGVHQVLLPWAREGSSFTLFFEALVMELSQLMPIKAMADMIEEYDTILWRIIHRHVEAAVEAQDLSGLNAVGVDETARRKGHKYITTFVNLANCKPVYAVEGKGKDAIKAFKEFLESHNGNAGNIKHFSCDMSPAFISGIQGCFPEAQITFDKFHVIKMMSEALDEVRRSEQKKFEELKCSRWLWLRNEQNLTKTQRETLNAIIGSKSAPLTTRAYGISQSLKRVYSDGDPDWAEAALKRWYHWASHCRIQPVVDFAKTVKSHWEGIINYFKSRWTNSILEALNSLFKAFSARARGYRSVQNAICAFFLACGKLSFNLPDLHVPHTI